MNSNVKHTNTDIIYLVGTLVHQLVNEDYRHAASNAVQITELIEELHIKEVTDRLAKLGA